MQLPLMFLDSSFVHSGQDATSSNVPQKKNEKRSPGRCAYLVNMNTVTLTCTLTVFKYNSALSFQTDRYSLHCENHPTSS